jgi:hypothetical protein
MKSLFAMEGIDYVEPAAEPVEGAEPDINFDAARIEENVLALDSAYAGIENALESLETLNQVKEAVGEGEELSPAALKIVQITVENIKAQLGVFPREVTAMESVVDGKLSMEGLGSVISSIWKAIANTFKWIWESIAGIFQTNKVVRQEKLIESKMQTMDKNGILPARRLTTGKLYNAYCYRNTPLNIEELRKISKELDNTTDGVFGLFEAASEAEVKLIKKLSEINERLQKETYDTAEDVGELAEITKDFIRKQVSYLERDSSIREKYKQPDYNPEALGRIVDMENTRRYGKGLIGGQVIVCRAVYKESDPENVYPEIGQIEGYPSFPTEALEIEEMDASHLLDFFDKEQDLLKSIGKKMPTMIASKRSKEHLEITKLEHSILNNTHVSSAGLKAFRSFLKMSRELGTFRIGCSVALTSIYASRSRFFDLILDRPLKK